MRIVLAVDGSAASDRAIELVATTAWPAGTTIRILHVAEPHVLGYLGMPGVVVSAETVAGIVSSDRERRQTFLAGVAAKVLGPGRTVETDVIEGRVPSAIVDAARELAADLIILGSHGRGALGSALLGSVAAEVVEYATTPVLVVRGPAISRLVLADDGSRAANAARALVARMPGFHGLPVHVVSVSERQTGWIGWLEPEAAGDIQAFEEALRADAEDHQSIAAASVAELAAAGLVADAQTPAGDPGTEIVRAAEAQHADLIVMGTRGQTGLERLLLGSVARKVLQQAHCSVLVIRAA